MWIDTHTHFDFSIFDCSRASDWGRAQCLGVAAQFVMSVSPNNFHTVAMLSERFPDVYFSLGIHPHWLGCFDFANATALLRLALDKYRDNPRFIGIGEIGLDGFITSVDSSTQEQYFTAQLALARDYEVPVFMHVRKAQDRVLKYCRQFGVSRGIAHAFNGSHQQADNYIAQGLKLGFGGAFTFERAKQLRRLVCDLPIEAFVLETDAPDMPPEWLFERQQDRRMNEKAGEVASGAAAGGVSAGVADSVGEVMASSGGSESQLEYSSACRPTNHSYQLPRIARLFAELRGVDDRVLSQQLWSNTNAVLNTAIPSIDKV